MSDEFNLSTSKGDRFQSAKRMLSTAKVFDLGSWLLQPVPPSRRYPLLSAQDLRALISVSGTPGTADQESYTCSTVYMLWCFGPDHPESSYCALVESAIVLSFLTWIAVPPLHSVAPLLLSFAI